MSLLVLVGFLINHQHIRSDGGSLVPPFKRKQIAFFTQFYGLDREVQIFKQHILNKDDVELENFAHQLVQRLTPHTENYRSNHRSISRNLRLLAVICQHYRENGEYEKIKELWNNYKQTDSGTKPDKAKYAPYQGIERLFVDQFRQIAIIEPKDYFTDYQTVYSAYVKNLENQKGKMCKQELAKQAHQHAKTLTNILKKEKVDTFNDPDLYRSTLDHIICYSTKTLDRLKFISPFAIAKNEKALKEFSQEAFLQLEQNCDLTRFSQRCKTEDILEELQEVMAANAENESFIQETLHKLDEYLQKTIFQQGLTLPETKKNNYEDLRDLFVICEQHLEKAEDALKLNLKVKLANLPREDRVCYKNVALSNHDQLDLIIQYYEKEEERYINELMSLQKFAADDRESFVKLVKESSPLKAEYKEKLRQRMNKNVNWNDREAIKNAFDDVCNFDQRSTETFKLLKRICKAKKFFLAQLYLLKPKKV